MIIKKIAFGDKKEAFIEDRLTQGLNVIYSDDNNRGKTLVLQGLMYSLGYESIFPSSFDYKNKFFYTQIEINGNTYEFLRKSNSLAIRTRDSIQIFNSIGEVKYFINKYIFNLPKIHKDGRAFLVDLSLFYEMFFVGQDNRNPSGLISKNQFNKSDFKSMVYDYAGLSIDSVNIDDIKDIKTKISNLKTRRKEEKKKLSLFKNNPNVAEICSKSYNSERYQEKIKVIAELNNNISKITRTRQREFNRKYKLEQLVKELHSLNRDLSQGHVHCGECGSDKIVYSNNDLSFDISNIDVRNGILKSIYENIVQKEELIEDYNIEINSLQNKLSLELKDTPPDFQTIVLYQEQLLSEKDSDQELIDISNEIRTLESQLSSSEQVDETSKVNRIKFERRLLRLMNALYKMIDLNGNLFFEDIFTKNTTTFSGSEGQEFYFCKILAIGKILKHDFPIIIDSFRDGELSSAKEEKMLSIYQKLNKQVILTSTLKNEEYSNNKYSKINNVNAIDYSNHTDCKILNAKYINKFLEILSNFEGIVI